MSSIVFEPFRIKSVEPIRMSTEAERREWIAAAGYNVFNLKGDQVMIDLLTDSGTGAMSHEQWASLMSGDESYAGSKNFYELEEIARQIFQKRIVLPVHQGRAAEHLLFSALVKKNDLIPANGHFDTTGANISDNGGTPVALPIAESRDLKNRHPFKGNVDLAALQEFLEGNSERVPFVMLTITNNTGGGQPVSLENIRATKALCERFDKPLLIDGCRFAENSAFIAQREPGFSACSSREIAEEIFRNADFVIFSGKKDGLANIGGLLCLDDAELGTSLKNRLILTEGFSTYGGLAGRDLGALAQGLREVLDETYLRYRLRTIEWMVERLDAAGIPVLLPSGGHGIYLEAGRFFPHLPAHELPGIALVVELYRRRGVRAVELGNVAFGKRNEAGHHIFPEFDWVRLAMPRRVYTEAHAGYVVEGLIEIYHERHLVRGYDFVDEEVVMRHFRSTFRPV